MISNSPKVCAGALPPKVPCASCTAESECLDAVICGSPAGGPERSRPVIFRHALFNAPSAAQQLNAHIARALTPPILDKLFKDVSRAFMNGQPFAVLDTRFLFPQELCYRLYCSEFCEDFCSEKRYPPRGWYERELPELAAFQKQTHAATGLRGDTYLDLVQASGPGEYRPLNRYWHYDQRLVVTTTALLGGSTEYSAWPRSNTEDLLPQSLRNFASVCTQRSPARGQMLIFTSNLHHRSPPGNGPRLLLISQEDNAPGYRYGAL